VVVEGRSRGQAVMHSWYEERMKDALVQRERRASQKLCIQSYIPQGFSTDLPFIHDGGSHTLGLLKESMVQYTSNRLRLAGQGNCQ
jgi:hypothetical protein